MNFAGPDIRRFNGRSRNAALVALVAGFLAPAADSVGAVYWNVFNIEGESALTANIVTYGTLNDMLTDVNRMGNFSPNTPGFGRNVVGSGSDGTTFWNVFNIEGESAITANIVTYGSLSDMLSDVNRTGNFSPNTPGFGRNVVGSGSDGTTYWNVFNIEGESAITSNIVTYSTLSDMLNDVNRTGNFSPNTPGFGRNVVDSGSDGTTYWNVFNIEGESAITANIVTYGSLSDMLSDVNRTGNFSPNTPGFGRNVVGSGAFVSRSSTIPDAGSSLLMLGVAVGVVLGLRRFPKAVR